jgi:methyl-accepting chemotaxis protein
MSTLLNRLLLWQKFVLLAVFGAILVAVPLTLYISESNKSVDAASLEARGVGPARALLKVVVLTQQHRGLSAMVLAGNELIQTQRTAKQEEVAKAFAEMDAIANKIGNAAIAPLWQEAKGRWAALAGKIAQRSLSGKESFGEHTVLVTQLLKINELIIDHFGLSLDPEVDSYYLVDVALTQSPVLMETLGRMRAKGSAMLTAKNASAEERAVMLAMIDKANERYETVRNSLEKSFAANSAIKGKLAEQLKATLAVGDRVLQLAQEQIVKPEQLTYEGPDFFTKVTDAINTQLKLYDGAIAELDALLVARQAKLATTKYLLIGVVLAISLLVALLGYLITRSITVPLKNAVDIAKRVAAGDLTTHILVTTDNETGHLLQALKDMNDSLVRIVAEVRRDTDIIASASSQIAAGNLDLSSRTEQQASSLEETASSMEQITGTVKQNADNARQANQLASSASEVASKGGAMVSHVVATMGSINDSSKKIVDIISVIDSIAFQTNILALNAAVEAARAGEQGKGFAVVASEVRSLAQRSAGAAKEIKELINDSVEKVDAGAKLVDQTGATMDEIVASIKRVNDIIAEITAASDEQSAGIGLVNEAINQMDQATQQNAALVEEAAAAAAALHEQAENLMHEVSVFRLEDMPAVNVQTGARPMHVIRKAPVISLSSRTRHVPRLGG